MKKTSISILLSLRNEIDRYRHDIVSGAEEYTTMNQTDATEQLLRLGLEAYENGADTEKAKELANGKGPRCSFSVNLESALLRKVEDVRYHTDLRNYSKAIAMLLYMGLYSYYKE
jgi:hypothetical protein